VLLLLVFLAAVSIAATVVTSASYTTSSVTDVTASAESVASWLHLYSQSTDPDGLGSYATQRVQSGVGPLCATGGDATLSLVMGGERTTNTTYTFSRVFTLKTATPFPESSVTQVQVAATYVADPTTGKQPIRDCRFSTLTRTRGNASVTLGANTTYQANIRMRMKGSGWEVGRTYRPIVRVTVSWSGGPAGYYVYDIPLAVTGTSW
jgi:hypothetical protein